MIQIRKATLAVTLSALSMQMFFLVSNSARADEEKEQSLEQIRSLAKRYLEGNPTKSDEEFISQHPEIGKHIVDSRKTTMGIITTDYAGAKTSNGGCHRADRYLNYEGAFNRRLFSYHTVVEWCEDGRSITKASFHDYFNNIEGAEMSDPRPGEVHELIKQKRYWTAYTQGSIANCVLKVGCVQTIHPSQKILFSAGKGNTTYQFYTTGDVGAAWHHERGENPFTR